MYTTKLINNWSQELDNFLLNQEYTHLWQSNIWFEMRERSNSNYYLVVVYDQSKNVKACAQFIYTNFLRNFSYCYVSSGPIWEKNNADALDEVLSFIVNHAKENKAVFLKIDPTIEELSDAENNILKKFHPINAVYKVKPRGTALINLNRDTDAILSSFEKDTRYSIRVAEKNEIHVVKGENKKDFEMYDRIIKLTESRQNFKQRDSSFFLSMLEHYAFGDPFFLLLAKQKETVIAGGIYIKYQKRFHYLAGGYDQSYSKLQAPSKLQFEAMKLAKELGCNYYDFFSYSLNEEPKFKLVDKFKENFKPEIRKWIYPQDIALNRIIYNSYRLIHTFKQ